MPERISWDELKPAFIKAWGWPDGKWEPEHLAILGPTGSGKSYFMTEVIDARTRKGNAPAVIIATKPADKTTRRLLNRGWKLKRTWPPGYGEERVIYWPDAGRPGESSHKQAQAIFKCLNELWKADANTIVAFDEIAYVEQDLRLRQIVTRYWREARALGITIVASTQRPRGVSRYMHSEPSWSVAFRPDDEDEARRVAEIIGSRRAYTPVLLDLAPYEFVMVRRRAREAYISRIE